MCSLDIDTEVADFADSSNWFQISKVTYEKWIIQKLTILRILCDIMAATSQIIWSNSRLEEVSYISCIVVFHNLKKIRIVLIVCILNCRWRRVLRSTHGWLSFPCSTQFVIHSSWHFGALCPTFCWFQLIGGYSTPDKVRRRYCIISTGYFLVILPYDVIGLRF